MPWRARSKIIPASKKRIVKAIRNRVSKEKRIRAIIIKTSFFFERK